VGRQRLPGPPLARVNLAEVQRQVPAVPRPLVRPALRAVNGTGESHIRRIPAPITLKSSDPVGCRGQPGLGWRPVTAYPDGMEQGTEKRFAEILEENGRPVTPAGMEEARTELAAAAERRNASSAVAARAELLAQLRTAAA